MTDDVNIKLDKLLAAIEKDGIEILTPEEIALFREGAKNPKAFKEIIEVETLYPGSVRSTARIHHALMATGFLANGVYSILYRVMAIAAIWFAIKAGAIEWLRAVVLGGRP